MKKEDGFSVVELAVIAVLVFAIAGIGLAVSKHKPGKLVSQNNTSASNVAPNRGPQKERCSVVEKACFQYPQDWQEIDTDMNAKPAELEKDGEYYRIYGTHGFMEFSTLVDYITPQAPQGKNCVVALDSGKTLNEPALFIHKVVPVKGVQDAYVVDARPTFGVDDAQIGIISGGGSQPKVGQATDCNGEFFKSRNHSGKYVQLTSRVDKLNNNDQQFEETIREYEAAMQTYAYQ